MVQAFKNENPSSFADDKAITLFIKGPRSLFWSLIICRKCFDRYEAGKTNRIDSGFCSPTDHHVRFTAPYVLRCRENGMARRRTGCGDGVVGAHEAGVDG